MIADRLWYCIFVYCGYALCIAESDLTYWRYIYIGRFIILDYLATFLLTPSLTHLLTHFLAHSLICYEKTRLDQWSSRTSRKWVPSVATRSTWKKWRDSRWQCCREGAARTLSHTHSRTHAFNALTNALTSHALTFFHSPKLFLMLSLTHHSCTP
jgi:hypothetical protein